MPMYWFHPADLLLIPAFIIAVWAQAKIGRAYSKYSKIPVSSGLTGYEIAKWILDRENISDVDVESIPGEMTDHYDPQAKKVRLSEEVFYGRSIASVGISAHELGHVLQHFYGYAPMQVRQIIYPISALGSNLSFPLIFIGIILAYMGFQGYWIFVKAGIYAFSLAVAFTIITLPVEFNASRRALKILSDGRLVSQKELAGVKEVLNAAALTYVASAAVAILQLIRLLIIFRNRD
ncbi:MAG: zinc metallopeptidase [Candidatus Hydrogenedentes bacterium]|nr:zinc metallopeptidase [Candidatus Hydrogenedentota bacterium]